MIVEYTCHIVEFISSTASRTLLWKYDTGVCRKQDYGKGIEISFVLGFQIEHLRWRQRVWGTGEMLV